MVIQSISVQYSPIFKNPSASMAIADKCISKYGISTPNKKIIVLPELCFTGYMFTSYNEAHPYAESLNDSISVQWAAKCASTYNAYVFITILELEDDKIYISMLCIDSSGSILAKHRKFNLFGDETKFVTPGIGHTCVDIKGIGIVGMCICNDINIYGYPNIKVGYNNFTDSMLNARYIIFAASIPVYSKYNHVVKIQAHWSKLVPKCAVFIASSRIGLEKGIEFIGGSCIMYNKIIYSNANRDMTAIHYL